MLAQAEALQGGATGPMVIALLKDIKTMIGDYVTNVRGKPVYDISAAKLAYRTVYQEAGTAPISKTWDLSGLALMPTASSGTAISAPIIAFQHGTQVNRRNAPSLFNPNAGATLFDFANPEKAGALQNYIECIIGAYMAATGCIVAMPDYPGFGSNTDTHPYVHRSLGDVVRDAVIATVELTKSAAWKDKVAWNGRVYLIGYSEGGYATMVGAMAIQQLADPGLVVKAAVPCDGSYDLSGTMAPRIAAGTPELTPYYVPYVLVGYNAIYGNPAFSFSSLLKDPYATALPPLFDGNHTIDQMKAAMPVSADPNMYVPSDVLTPEAIADLKNPNSPLFLYLAASDAYRNWVPAMKMLIIHCVTDDIVPVANATAAHDAFRAGGATLVTREDVLPVDLGDQTVEVHLRAFPSAILRGFTYIDGIETTSP
jgi:pimeloyl-ACP methyl ester carboxylesterase